MNSSDGGVMETRTLTTEEEALKRNTDCIYFLASPLTCKKGKECEYRHSEGARLNPRDCYYWLNSTCMNPKCAFRHPPLDGLPQKMAVASKQIPMEQSPAYNMNKQSVACIYFQKGHCLKGERCPFSHGTQDMCNPAPPKTSSLPEQRKAIKVESWGFKQCTNQQLVRNASAMSSENAAIRAENPTSNGLSHAKNLIPHPSGNKLARPQAAHAPPVINKAQNHLIRPSDEHLQNGLEPGEIVGEHSLVFNDSTMKSSSYMRYGYEFGRKSAQGGDYGKHRPSDYNKPAPVCEISQFEKNGWVEDYYDTKPRRISSERSTLLPERREVQRRRSPDEVVDKSDLRHRLKQRKIDDSDKIRGHHSRRDQLQALPENLVSTRLRGRISLPEREVSRNQGRLSPTRPYDRTRRSSEGPNSGAAGGRSLGGRLSRIEDVDSLNFTGPKCLAELKGVKPKEQSTKSISGNQKNGASEVSLSFDSPKPLNVLLKRKREEAPVAVTANSSDVDENTQRNESFQVCDEEVHRIFVESNKEEPVEEELLTPSRNEELIYEGQSLVKDDELEAEDYMEVDGANDQELQNFEGDDEYDYEEATETGEFKTEYEDQGEEEEDDDLDDEEAFAKKVGLVLS